MANTPLPLDIGFYDADGAPINRTTMEPCPEGTDATCPIYASRPSRSATRSKRPRAPAPTGDRALLTRCVDALRDVRADVAVARPCVGCVSDRTVEVVDPTIGSRRPSC